MFALAKCKARITPSDMSATDLAADKQRLAHLFKPGQSGNPAGRPKGSRSKLSENFLADLHDCWERRGAEALETCSPEVLIKTIASLLPRDLRIDVTHNVAEFAGKFRSALELLGNTEPPRLRKPLPGRVIEHDG
jgi:uncharacterized protein DUF5681